MPDFVAETLADPAVSALGLAIAGAFVALWLAAAWWAYADATRRTEHSLAGFVAAGWILLSTPLLLPLSLAVYVFARPQVPAGDQRVRTLMQEFGAIAALQPRCNACGALTDPAWLRCPTCTSWLASACAACGRWSDETLEACPWCGDEARERPAAPERPAVPEPAGVLTFPITEPLAAAVATAPAGAAAPATSAADAPTRRHRLAWRALSPGVHHAQRTEHPRLAPAPDGRRPSRVRLGRA